MILKQFYYKRNRIQQLKGFYYAVQNRSISKAAKKMGLTQSAVTLQIQSLERDLGVKLFIRDKQKIILTPEARTLYAQSAHYICGLDELFESFIKNVRGKNSNIIDIASNHAGISYILPKYIKEFHEENPSTKFKIRNLSLDEGLRRLVNDEIDMFIYPMIKDEIPEYLDFTPIVQYQPILLTKATHPLAKKKDLTLKDVSKFELVRIDPKLITLPAFEEIIKAHELHTSFEFEMSDWEILKKFVRADIGVAIISDIILEDGMDKDLVGRPLLNYFPKMTYGVLTKRGKVYNNLLKNFIKSLSSKKLLNAHKKKLLSKKL
jgi:DNA-binding transcriptional LysR family regulator